MARKRFSFKSSGKLVTAREYTAPTIVQYPVGIKTPLEFSVGKSNEDFYRMHFDAAAQIKDNFRNLLLTNFGERLGRANLGANLKSLLYDSVDLESVEAEAVRRITVTAGDYLPMVQIKNINVRFLGLDTQTKDISASPDYQSNRSSGLSGMVVFVSYSIPRLGIDNQAIEAILSIGG